MNNMRNIDLDDDADEAAIVTDEAIKKNSSCLKGVSSLQEWPLHQLQSEANKTGSRFFPTWCRAEAAETGLLTLGCCQKQMDGPITWDKHNHTSEHVCNKLTKRWIFRDPKSL